MSSKFKYQSLSVAWLPAYHTTVCVAQACVVALRFNYFDNLTVIIFYLCQISLALRLFAEVTKESCEQSGRHRILPSEPAGVVLVRIMSQKAFKSCKVHAVDMLDD